jgi:hypothetical protein
LAVLALAVVSGLILINGDSTTTSTGKPSVMVFEHGSAIGQMQRLPLVQG